MSKSLPSTACWEDRPTGASSMAMPRAVILPAMRSVTEGAMVLMSMKRLPCFSVSAAPPFPKAASSTCCPFGSMVMTQSAPRAASAADVAAVAPAETSACTAFGSISKTRSAKAALSRLRAIGAPMVPSPMKPM